MTLPRQNYPPEYLNIHATAQSANGFAERGMNSFQKRLVHQLVRAEHGGLVSISRAGFMQIMPLDLKREEAIKTSKMKSFTEKVARQVGLRWLIEGMIGGDIDQVNPLSFARSQDGEPIWINVKEEESKFEKLKKTLSGQRTVLVGHNLFMDLVNFYKCFLGRLPDTVEEFQKKIHRIFPLVIDTKYMATADNPSPNAKSGLADLDIRTSKMSEPIIGKL